MRLPVWSTDIYRLNRFDFEASEILRVSPEFIVDSFMASITVRVRSQLGVWRVESVKVTSLFSELRKILEKEHKTEIISPFSLSPWYSWPSLSHFFRRYSWFFTYFIYFLSGKDPINETITLKAAGIKHGDMLYITVNEEKSGIHEAAASSLKKITKDGTIVAQGI